MKILWLSLIIQCRCKEISINTFQKPSSTVSASKFEIFVRNILSAYIWLDLKVLGSKKSISMNQIRYKIQHFIKFWGRYIGRWFLKCIDTYFLTPVWESDTCWALEAIFSVAAFSFLFRKELSVEWGPICNLSSSSNFPQSSTNRSSVSIER